jgi:hypothetical protein
MHYNHPSRLVAYGIFRWKTKFECTFVKRLDGLGIDSNAFPSSELSIWVQVRARGSFTRSCLAVEGSHLYTAEDVIMLCWRRYLVSASSPFDDAIGEEPFPSLTRVNWKSYLYFTSFVNFACGYGLILVRHYFLNLRSLNDFVALGGARLQ